MDATGQLDAGRQSRDDVLRSKGIKGYKKRVLDLG